MKRKIFFCKGWFRAKKVAVEILTESEVQSEYEKEGTFTVLVDSPSHPYCIIEIAKSYFGVGFLDDVLRETLVYQFHEVSEGELFLKTAIYREFEGKSDQVKSGVSYFFDEKGSVRIVREIFFPAASSEFSVKEVDVSKNYRRLPMFGEYDDLIHIEV